MRTCSILNQTMGQPREDVRVQYADLLDRVDRLHDDAFAMLVNGIEPLLLHAEGRSAEAAPMFGALMRATWRTDFGARMAAYDWPDCLLAIGDHEGALAATVPHCKWRATASRR